MTTPSEYPSLSLIRQGVNYRFKIRSRGLELLVRPLSIMEEDQVVQDVAVEMEKLPPHQQTSIRQTMLLSIKRLELAQSKAPGDLTEVRIYQAELQQLTPGELDHLFKQYLSGCDKINPMLEKLDAGLISKQVEELKKNSSDREMILIELSFFQLVAICQSLLSTEHLPTGS